MVPHRPERRPVLHEEVTEVLKTPFEAMHQCEVVVVRHHQVFRVSGRVDHLYKINIQRVIK